MGLVVKYTPASAVRDAATYGGGTYGGNQTYGQEASDPLPNVEFVLTASPGRAWPSEVGWEFRSGDIGSSFSAVGIGVNGLLPLNAFTQAVLVIERVSAGPRVCRGFEATLDTDTDVISYQWRANDLEHPGTYRVLIQLISDSGRPITIDGADYATMVVRAGGSD